MTVTIDDINEAAERIAPWIEHTPVMRSESLDRLVGAELHFKCEHLQKAGAFKSRGAVNAVFSLPKDQAQKGVATHSSGNHGSALARAAMLAGIPAWIVVPANAKEAKKEAIRSYGGEIIECEPTLEARQATLEEVVAQTGAIFIPPYDDDRIIAGQGTAALELAEQVPFLDAIVTPVGGGGLLAGTAIVGRERRIRVFGGEPEMADDARRSFITGERVASHVPNTIADGLLTTLGERNFEIIREHAEDILLVSEHDIVSAMGLLWTRLKQVVEPSAAVSLASIIVHRHIFEGKKVGLVLTGGNVDINNLPFQV